MGSGCPTGRRNARVRLRPGSLGGHGGFARRCGRWRSRRISRRRYAWPGLGLESADPFIARRRRAAVVVVLAGRTGASTATNPDRKAGLAGYLPATHRTFYTGRGPVKARPRYAVAARQQVVAGAWRIIPSAGIAGKGNALPPSSVTGGTVKEAVGRAAGTSHPGAC